MSFSSQMAINCNAGGDCKGGDPLGLLKFVSGSGITEGSCQNYVGENPASFTCTGIQVCETCSPPIPPPHMQYIQDCVPIDYYESWYINSYGMVSGVSDMQQSIFSDGPIACSI
mmetsp:Transcript_9006/g.7935  ORF Transcript_9006/g.7935 Transcript_9006/m.7935 type:complete len:114 (-) Transcript_9006:306-647(-)